ncbi:hypothetical protein K439DRAFT_1335112 [Ramaria rubella]|nr:hypothetical protein K439DRAFT_1335112 [Ramaria rubella]
MTWPWEIGPISKPRFVWGAKHSNRIHQCPFCHILLLTGECPGFCCGNRGSQLNNVPPLPPLPDEFNVFLDQPNISQLSRIFNLVYSFASLESTVEFPELEGPPSFFCSRRKTFPLCQS